jgi:hypothetical protein
MPGGEDLVVLRGALAGVDVLERFEIWELQRGERLRVGDQARS